MKPIKYYEKMPRTTVKDQLQKLYKSPLPSTRTGALYNAFSYPTKISPEVIALFIATHTAPGETILDAFGGSGTAGLAALLCDKPTENMIEMATKLGISPVWGPRNAILFEIGVLGSFISKILCNPPDLKQFSVAVDSFVNMANEQLGKFYLAIDPSGNRGIFRHAIWSDILICPKCRKETSFWDAAVRRKPLSMASDFVCTGCNETIGIDKCDRAIEKVKDEFGGQEITRRKRVLAQVYGATGSKKWQRKPMASDLETISIVADSPLPASAPNKNLEWGDLHRAGYHAGITKLHHFYTRRNFFAISKLWELTENFPKDIRDALYLLILSYNSSHSTLMTRVVVKKGQNDFVLTGSQSGVLYISGLPVEKNIITGISRKAKSFIEAFRLVEGSKSSVMIKNESSEKISLPDGSIDYVFTDPPFGDYIPYAEINQLNELWLGETTNRSKEIIVSNSQKKNIDDYARMMATVFDEMARVLKPNGFATVVFHSAHSNIWRALTEAYSGAGFSVTTTSVLDKLQSSFKQVVAEVSVKGDPLILLSKEKKNLCSVDVDEIIAELVLNIPKISNDPQRMWSMFIGKCLEQDIQVPISAREFYARVKSSME
jgi:DNA modification methylase